MAFGGGAATKLYINGYDLTSYFNNTQPSGTAGAYDTSVYGVGSKQYIPGLKDDRWVMSGFFDGGDDADDEVLAAALGVASGIAMYWPQGDAVGAAGRGISGHLIAYGPTAPVDGAVSISAEIQSSVGPERILSLVPLGVLAEGETNGTAIDNGAASDNGGVGYVEATAIDATTATIKIQHSDDNSVWVDLITFTAITAANAKERKTVAGAVEQYVRHNTNATDGGITAAIGFGRK